MADEHDFFIPAFEILKRYKNQIKVLLESSGSKSDIIDLGRLPEIYTVLGITDKQLKINGKTILKALGLEGRNKHKVPMETIENLLSLVYDPEAVFKSLSVSNNPNAYIAVLNAKTKNQEQIIAILSPSRDGQGFTFIPSVYEKHNFKRFLSKIHEEQKTLYIKNKGSELWGQLQSLPRHNSEPYSKNILTKSDVVKRIIGNSENNGIAILPKQGPQSARRADQNTHVKEQSMSDQITTWHDSEIGKEMANMYGGENNKAWNQHLYLEQKRAEQNAARKKQAEVRKQRENSARRAEQNITVKEQSMSDELKQGAQTFRPSIDAAEKVAKEDAVRNAYTQRKMVLNSLQEGTLSCLPGKDGFADTQPAKDLVNGKTYHGINLLYLKNHTKRNGFPTAEYLTEEQIDKAAQDNPGIAIRQGEKAVPIHWQEKNEQTDKWENKNVWLYNVAQTTKPDELKSWVEQEREESYQKWLEQKRIDFPGYVPPEPKQKTSGPEIECTSTDPEKYLGQYLAAVSMNGKFKASPEQAAEFSQKMEDSLSEIQENGYPDTFRISKISNSASKYCKDVISEVKMVTQKEEYQQEHKQEQTQSNKPRR